MHVYHMYIFNILCYFKLCFIHIVLKNQFCSRSSKGRIGAVPVVCSLTSHSAIQLCGVSFLFQAVIGWGSTKNENITGVQMNCKSNPRFGPTCVLCCYK